MHPLPIKQVSALRQLQSWIAGLMLLAAASVGAAPFQLSEVQSTGTEASLSLQTTLTLATEDVGKPIHIFVVAQVPDGAGNKWYARSPKAWLAVAGGTLPVFQTHAAASASTRVDLSQSEDARGLAGTHLYAGYGMSAEGANAAFAEMLLSSRYRMVYSFPAGPSAADWSLQPATEPSLKAYFREVLGVAGRSYFATPWAVDFIAVSTTSASAPAAAVGVSGTTLQEAGVDEADRVKSDGKYVFSLAGVDPKTSGAAVLLRQSLQSAAARPELAEVDRLAIGFSKNIEATGLFQDVQGQQIAVLGEGAGRWAVYDAWFAPQARTQGVTEMALVETISATRMQIKRKLRINASLVGSRKLGNTLYLVLRSTAQLPCLDPWWPVEKTAANQSLLDALQVSAVLPTLSVDCGAALPLLEATATPHAALPGAPRPSTCLSKVCIWQPRARPIPTASNFRCMPRSPALTCTSSP